ENGATKFARDEVALGFEVMVRDASDGKVLVRLVPHARFRDPGHLIPTDGGERDVGTEDFPAAGFEVALSPTEFLVVGTDSYRARTCGLAAFRGPKDAGGVRRLPAPRAGRTGGARAMPDASAQAVAPPLASQATAFRGVSP